MKKLLFLFIAVCFLNISFFGISIAQDKGMKHPVMPKIKETTSTTVHSISIGGKKIEYTATAGTMILKDEMGHQRGSFFYMSYTKNGVTDVSKRPLTYSFNGGPGSSSVWLHMGLLGPRRVLANEDGTELPPPYKLVDNEWSMLDKTDMVFIDPISTGLSRPVPGVNKSEFHGLEQDIESVGDFIRMFTSRTERWSSPKFIIGESYGTTRAAGLSQYLQGKGMFVNGIMLVSSILNFGSREFSPNGDMGHILYLPTYTAAAFYHGKLSGELAVDLEATLRKAEEFALGEFSTALMKGAAISDSERDRIATKLSSFIGVSKQYILNADLRITNQQFNKELLRDRGYTIGRLDGRFLGRDRDNVGETYEYDPSMSAIMGSYTATMNDYLQRELNYKTDAFYNIFGSVRPWDYSGFTNRSVNVAERLRAAMAEHPALKVFIASGYMDFATPYFATRYTFNHMQLHPDVRNNITWRDYPAGHMMYISIPELKKMKIDLDEFIDSSK